MKRRRPHLSLSVKLEAALLALGLDPKSTDWHHQPPLSIRPYDPVTNTWTPAFDDPRYLVPMDSGKHRERTAKVDVPVSAKVRRLTKKEEQFRAVLLAKSTGDDKPRDVRKRQWPKRTFRKKRK